MARKLHLYCARVFAASGAQAEDASLRSDLEGEMLK